MLLKLLIVITTILFSSSSYSATDSQKRDGPVRDELLFEKQEIVLAQAELLVLDEGVKSALLKIKENLDSRQFHLNSFLFLAKLHERVGNNSRSMRVYYYAIRKMHGKELLAANSGDHLETALKKMPPPAEEALRVYIKIAQIYHQMANKGDYPTNFTPRLMNLSLKYYKICQYYKYQLPSVEFQMAQIKRQQNNFIEAINHYWEAKELLEDNQENREQIDMINYLLGASLISAGRRNAGAEYLKNIHQAKGVSTSLQGYANDYLDALSYEFTMLSATLSSEYSSNYFSLSETELDALDPATDASPSAWFDSLYVLFYYTSQSYKNWSYSVSATWNETKLKDDSLSNGDSRSIGFSSDLQNNTFTSFLLKLGYNYTFVAVRSDLRSATDSRMKKSYALQGLTPQLTYISRSGTTNFSLSLTSYHYVNVDTDPPIYRTYSLSYTPFSISKYFSPSYSLSYSINDSEIDYTNDTINLSFSNHLALIRTLSLFGSLDFLSSSNDSPNLQSDNYTQYTASLSLNYITPISDTLTASLLTTKSLTMPDEDLEGDHINAWTMKLSVSYNF
ncbi:MAG: hypothetical protein HN353_05405 [Bdellovibrionales bacterium]|nr:hypothetical protein [Bdellovibrionales bacterium]MBT3525121.1 hypothetical protein [Bdellovibrionales bacterium]MBT7669673.1 hypothetical protein [Bdellovibrionales bacterium]MBT7768005.1 hypothetical protein [Bdellovibrionales bacterium]